MQSKKKENFKRISSKRLEKLADDFRLLGNLSNTANYEYSKKDIDKMFEEIDSMYSELKRSFQEGSSKKKFHF